MPAALNPVYKRLCPVCGGEAEADSLEETGICNKCLLRNSNGLNAYTLHQVLRDELQEFKRFFEKITGFKLWGAQETWVKRLLNRENTVIIAPTGMGKTTLLLVYTLYMARYDKKTLILAPTKALAKQIYTRLLDYSGKASVKARIIYYDSSKSKKKREEILNQIQNNEYDILVLTNHFMIRRSDLINRDYIDLIIVDDVDSLLKSNRNIKRLIKLMGYDENIIEKMREKHRILWKLVLSRTFDNQELFNEYITKLLEIEEEIERELKSKPRKQVVIASATGRMKGVYAKILRDLLMIDVSGITIYGRNITDTYKVFNGKPKPILEVLEKLGPGGLILVSPRHPFKSELEKLASTIEEDLRSKGYRVDRATPRSIEKFTRGELDYVIGTSSYYGVSVRGIDAPETIKYVVFLGTPVFTIELESLLSSPSLMIRTALYLYEVTRENRYRELAVNIRKRIFTLNPGELRILSMMLKGKLTVEDVDNDKLKGIYEELLEYYKVLVEETKELLRKHKVLAMNTITLLYRDTDERYLAIIPDVYTYIQASGRSSRLYLGRMTHGLSIIFEYSILENLVKSLDLRMGFYANTRLFKPLDSIDLDKELEEIKRSREKMREGRVKYKNVLLVVESPTKAKTIARFFGKPVRRKIGSLSIYEIPFTRGDEILHLNILATRGHIFDLTTEPSKGLYGILFTNGYVAPVYDTIKRCRVCGHQFTYGDNCPRCGSKSYIDSIEVVNVLRKLAEEAHEIFIATDPDIEGEKIAYDVYLVVKSFNKNIWRIELHEITLREFMHAIENKRSINKKLVEAEIYRRVLDRLIGFSLSQKLWSIYGKKWFGAGRVQTPVLGWVIDRFREYNANKCRKIVYKLIDVPGLYVKVCIPYGDKELYKKLLEIETTTLTLVRCSDTTINPAPPYTTDQLLYDAARQGIPASTAMKIAQELFESGLITYHRTNSTYVSSTGINVAMKYLEEKGLAKYSRPSHWGSPGAHEAIRPVYPLDRYDLEKAVAEGLISPVVPLTGLHYRVYDMIFKRFIASQMKSYRVKRSLYKVDLGGLYGVELTLDTRVIEDGFNLIVKPKIYVELEGKDKLESRVEVVAKYVTSTTPLYSEGDIILKMKKEGLGRPSTYAKILGNLRRHGYVLRSKKRGFLIPSKTGIEVYSYLSRNYPELVSVEVTRKMESIIDLIAEGRYSSSHAILEVLETIKEHGLITGREALLEANISS